ncbi:hypothetical protein ACKC9G_10745 [Pokkaliibacter sp. CJK22405]|uniref:hypothetical protein n=1 Tax=Pokkaliibacter sp. CJK22405 TaxID=3384615 RepID=UPI003984F233
MRRQIAACAIVLGIILACTASWPGSVVPSWPAGLSFWTAALLLSPDIARRNLKLSLCLAGLGLLGIVWGIAKGQSATLGLFFSANASLVAMVTSVSFLALLAASAKGTETATSDNASASRTGTSIFSTLLGVHLFGSVINMSAAFMFGDRMAQGGKLSLGQSLILSRASTLGAFWSPFYAAMAVGLSVAPEANVFRLMLLGFPVALIGLLLSYWQLKRSAESLHASGVPVSFQALAVPFLMASLVLGIHALDGSIPILTLVTLLAPSLAIIIATLRRGVVFAKEKTAAHIQQRLPSMGNEVLLFLSAGLLTQGGKSLIASLGGWQLFPAFETPQAILMFVATVLLSLLGFHPIIGISLFSAVLGGTGSEPSLLAMVSICAWGVGTAVGPLSGINLALFGRYGADTYAISRHTLGYAAVMCIVVAMALWLMMSLGLGGKG